MFDRERTMQVKAAFPLRLPADVKAWLIEQAARNASSQNSEIVRAVRERMERVRK